MSSALGLVLGCMKDNIVNVEKNTGVKVRYFEKRLQCHRCYALQDL
jgi:hypothetical protein